MSGIPRSECERCRNIVYEETTTRVEDVETFLDLVLCPGCYDEWLRETRGPKRGECERCGHVIYASSRETLHIVELSVEGDGADAAMCGPCYRRWVEGRAALRDVTDLLKGGDWSSGDRRIRYEFEHQAQGARVSMRRVLGYLQEIAEAHGGGGGIPFTASPALDVTFCPACGERLMYQGTPEEGYSAICGCGWEDSGSPTIPTVGALLRGEEALLSGDVDLGVTIRFLWGVFEETRRGGVKFKPTMTPAEAREAIRAARPGIDQVNVEEYMRFLRGDMNCGWSGDGTQDQEEASASAGEGSAGVGGGQGGEDRLRG